MTSDSRAKAGEQVTTLLEALPYIRRFSGAVVVVKLGGNAMGEASLIRHFAEDIVLMHSVGIHPVVVHGGGPQIGEVMARLGKEPEFRDGLRVTDAETLDIARMVLVGKVNREIVSAINRHAPVAVGVSGEDAGLISARQRHADLGFVGDVTDVDPKIVHSLIRQDLIPVISTIGADASGGQSYNINADTVAGAIAAEMAAEKLVYLTDVAGLLEDRDDPDTLVSRVTVAQLRLLLSDDAIAGGMIPKIEACLAALDRGVTSAHLLDGRIPHVLLLEVFTDEGVGTMMARNESAFR